LYGIKSVQSGLFDHHVELSYFSDICELVTIFCLVIGFSVDLSVFPLLFLSAPHSGTKRLYSSHCFQLTVFAFLCLIIINASIHYI
jgi:hypothetical protein